jgi:hypothetical protein
MMAYRVALTRVSKNVKTGPIPVSTTDEALLALEKAKEEN